MDFKRWPHADALIDEALALPAGARAAFVQQAAGDDHELREALEAVMLEALGEDDFLAPPEAREPSSASADVPPASQPLALVAGARIEHYEVVGLIGRGGMGEVYGARDLRLGRDVALKVLPEMSARDEERRARFRREARVLAMLSHPGIGAIYGVAEAPGVEALVLELVEGPTLSDRLAHGALPIPVSLEIARHLVDAVAAAHARGILHRDLKPANIKILPGERVKVLDFGLAKALAPDRGPISPDLTADSPHVLLGTAGYMSPEQIRQSGVDARADVWAFGCILFEMLTGSRAFDGTSINDVLARVLERDPPFSRLPAGTPEPVRRLLRRTLEKDPVRRLGYIADARLELDDAAIEGDSPDVRASPAPLLTWKGAAVVALAVSIGAIGGSFLMWRAQPEAGRSVSRFIVPLGAGETPVTGFQPMLSLAPDGRTIVYRANRDGVVRLFRRALSDLEAVEIPGTENATAPFFSPDGRWLGFDGDGVLKRVAVTGGSPVVIAPAPGGATATWLPDDSIVFATNTTRVLQRVPAAGGQPEPITALDSARGDTQHALPHALSDGRTVLFTIVAGASRTIAAVDVVTRQVTVLWEGSHARSIPPAHVIFAREGALWGAGLTRSGSTVALTVPPIPLVDGIEHTDNTVLHFDVSADGSMAYLPAGQTAPHLQRLVWIDRDGRETPFGLEARPYTRISLSPDGRRLAFTLGGRENTDIWVADPERGTTSRLTVDPTIETSPTWSPDGRHIAFRSEREGPGLFRRDAQGAGPIERLTTTDGPIHSPYSWTPDGRTLLLALFRSFNRQAIARVTPPDSTVHVLLDGEFAQLDPQVSPDGRWLAYQSDETGRFEVYVRPYPDVRSGRWQISSSGGTSPRFGPDGRELFYYDGAALVTARLAVDGSRFSSAPPVRLFAREVFGGRFGPDYEVAPDGRQFLFIVADALAEAAPAHIVFVQHWAAELQARLSAPH